MERKGYYNGYSYMGLVGSVYMPFASEAEYHQYLDGEKPTGAVLKARKLQMKKQKEGAMSYFEDKLKSELYESEDDMVSHPSHYQSESGLEVIDVIKAFTAGLDGIEAAVTGNIIKYICRWKKKNGIQDLEKILWYTTYLISYLKAKGDEK
jgi:hypothetical protein